MRVGRIETLDGLPILDVAGVDITRRPHPAWQAAVATLPERVGVVFAPEFRTGWRVEGQEITGCWIVLRKGSVQMPSWVSSGGLRSNGGATLGWRSFWPARVPSELMKDEPGRPYLLQRPDEVAKAIRVLRDATAWRAEDVPRVAMMHRNASRAAARAAIQKAREERIEAFKPYMAAAARELEQLRGVRTPADRRLKHAAMEARDVETAAHDEFMANKNRETEARYMQAQARAVAAERAARNA
jgi:hypothetical protein